MKIIGSIFSIGGAIVASAVFIWAPMLYFPLFLTPAILVSLGGLILIGFGYLEESKEDRRRELAELADQLRPVHVLCPHCHRANEISRSLAGQMIACQWCGYHFPIPSPQSPGRVLRPATMPYRRKSSDATLYIIITAAVLLIGGGAVYLVYSLSRQHETQAAPAQNQHFTHP